jgi:hypothetical protein
MNEIKFIKILVWVINLLVISENINGIDYYISAKTGSDSNNGLTTTTAFKSISKVVSYAKPGDTINIMEGTYTSTTGPILNLKPEHSGSENNYITYKAYEGHLPKIFISGNVWNAISVNASYIIIDGLELQGNNANLTYDAAYKAYSDYLAGTASPNGVYNTNGISIGGPRMESKLPHHIIIRNCKIHDFPGGGLSAIQADYVTFENNLIYNNAWYMMYGGSGISILCPFNYDNKTTYKNIIRNNICYHNKTLIPWASQKKLSDGNGIIIDVNQTPYPEGADTRTDEYHGRTLVENNLSYNNGGSGIHAYKANHVDIFNNTTYHNGIVVGYANIFAGSSSDVKIMNNIMYAMDWGKCNTNSNNDNATVIYDYNVYFNGTVAVQGENDRMGNPGFIFASTDPELANFQLKSNGLAIDTGDAAIAPLKDILGVTRPKGLGIDCGAFEHDLGTDVEKISTQESFKVYPLPAKNYIYVEGINSESVLKVEIYTLSGALIQTVHSVPKNRATLETGNLKPGYYLLRVNNLFKFKFVKL